MTLGAENCFIVIALMHFSNYVEHYSLVYVFFPL